MNNRMNLLWWSKKNGKLVADVLRNERRRGKIFVSEVEEEGDAFFRFGRVTNCLADNLGVSSASMA